MPTTSRSRLLLTSALILGIFVPVLLATSQLTVLDNEPFEGAPGDNMVFSVRRNGTYVVSMHFVTGQPGDAVTHRLNDDGTLSFVGRNPAGTEPRAIAMARNGDYAVVVNSIVNDVVVMSIGDDGQLREVNRYPSGGSNPFDVAVGFNDIVVVANRDSDTIQTFGMNKRGELTPVDGAPTGIDPHVVVIGANGAVAVEGPGGISGAELVEEKVTLVAVANQTGQSISLFRMNKAGALTPLGDIPLGKTPRTLSWLKNKLFVALDEPGAPLPGTPEDTIRSFEIGFDGTVRQGPDTPAGHFLTDLEATKKGVVAVTVNQNGALPDKDEVRVYKIDDLSLTLDASVQTAGAFPSFKQVSTIKAEKPLDLRIIVTEFQGGFMRSLIYDK